MRLAREVGDALCAAAEERDGGLCWKSRSEWSEQSGYNPDLYAGASGIGLFLAELARATGEARYADAARGAARWLSGPIWGRGRAQHGLHCGEPGVTHFLLRLADLLNAPGYVTAAELRMRRLRGAQPITLDLIYGTAGTILPLLSLYRVTGESAFLADACAAGDELVRSALAAPEGSAGCYWDVPSGARGGPVISYLGLLHGAAGIGLALGRLAIVTSEERYMHTARRAAELLLAQARPSSADVATEGPALTWPRHLGDNTMGLQAHCHGAGGIGQFFLWLDRVVPDPRYLEAARGAGRTAAAQRDTEQRSGICHGLSGIGHIMIDSYQALDDEQWLAVARECAGQLQRFCVADRTGVYAMDGAGAVSPDLMLGYAGVGSLFLRLADPENAQDLIFGDPAHPRDI